MESLRRNEVKYVPGVLRIEKVIVLSTADYEKLAEDISPEYPFLKNNRTLMTAQPGGTFRCLLVTAETEQEGMLLALTENTLYAGRAQNVPGMELQGIPVERIALEEPKAYQEHAVFFHRARGLDDITGRDVHRPMPERQTSFRVELAVVLSDTHFRQFKECGLMEDQMDGVQGYHLVQSFAEGELTPELAHRIGLELAERLLHGQYPAVIATHLNTHCLHNHIVWDSVAMDTGRKYRSSAKTYYTGVRAESDRLCRQYGLSVIESPESERGKKQYGKWMADQYVEQMRFLLRHGIDSREQLAEYRKPLLDEIAVLTKERHGLYRSAPDSPRIGQITARLKVLRKESRMCGRIEKRSVEIGQRLTEARAEQKKHVENEKQKGADKAEKRRDALQREDRFH